MYYILANNSKIESMSFLPVSNSYNENDIYNNIFINKNYKNIRIPINRDSISNNLKDYLSKTILNDNLCDDVVQYSDIEKYNILLDFSKKILENDYEPDFEIMELINNNLDDLLL